ncbi:hypothetical protein SO802_000300 [Lithocarpus litseifolius]|uniref:Uncharacterized protein n=1 Tax=Lithocarpus litseifolius TaxID=425828 RepID=A0AAW2DWD7_9ROSI
MEMLESFLDPAIATSKSAIAFGNLSSSFLEKQETTCVTALNVIHTAVRKPAVLPSLESEWRHGSIAPSWTNLLQLFKMMSLLRLTSFALSLLPVLPPDKSKDRP